MKKEYKPKRKSYNDLTSLYNEMVSGGVKVAYFDGCVLKTKNQKWSMFEGKLIEEGDG